MAADWPQFLGPNRDGVSTETGLTDAFPDGGPKIVWRIKVGGGFAGPVVVGDRVVLFHFKDGEEILEAFRVADGASIWKNSYPCDYDGGMFREKGPRATPTIAGENAIAYGSSGVLQCVRLRDGYSQWRKPVDEKLSVPESFFGVACSPLVVEGLILLNVGGRAPQGAAGVCAFQVADGMLEWHAIEDAAGYSSPVSAMLGGRRTALFFARSGLHAVDPKSGKLHFHYPFRARIDASVNAATPLVWNDRVFLTSSYGVGAVLLDCKQATPRRVWKSDEVLSCHFNTPVKVGEYLYGIDGRQEGGAARLVCVEAETGALKWSEPNFGCASIIAADGKLFILRENGELVLCRADPTRYHRLGAATVANGVCRAAPALADGKLYVKSEGELVCVEVGRAPSAAKNE